MTYIPNFIPVCSRLGVFLNRAEYNVLRDHQHTLLNLVTGDEVEEEASMDLEPELEKPADKTADNVAKVAKLAEAVAEVQLLDVKRRRCRRPRGLDGLVGVENVLHSDPRCGLIFRRLF